MYILYVCIGEKGVGREGERGVGVWPCRDMCMVQEKERRSLVASPASPPMFIPGPHFYTQSIMHACSKRSAAAAAVVDRDKIYCASESIIAAQETVLVWGMGACTYNGSYRRWDSLPPAEFICTRPLIPHSSFPIPIPLSIH